MKKYTGQEWAFFRNRAGRVQFNSYAAAAATAASRASGQRFSLAGGMKAENSRRKHLKSTRISQGLWKRENDTRNRSRFSPNGDGEKGEATARFRVFLFRFKESIPKQEKQTKHP